MRISRGLVGALAITGWLCAGVSSAHASTIVVLDSCITGDCGAYLGGPVTITMDSVVGGISVEIDNDTNGYVGYVNLLFDGSVSDSDTTLTEAAAASFTTYTPTGVLNGATMSTHTYSTTFTDAGLSFNVFIDLPPPPGQSTARLGPGETISFWIAGLTLSDYQGALAHVQSLEDCEGLEGCGGSVKLVPEGGTTASLIGLALLALALGRRYVV